MPIGWGTQLERESSLRSSILLDDDFGFEVEARREAEVLMRRSGIAVRTTVLAASVRVHAGREAHIWAVVARDYRAGGFQQQLRGDQRFATGRFRVVGAIAVIVSRRVVNSIESIRRVGYRAATAKAKSPFCLH
jgi:hypothetical protein